ncbi:MAG: exodeoxyribonuclease VII large subunit, partial [Xanthobacteraceae bacterium]
QLLRREVERRRERFNAATQRLATARKVYRDTRLAQIARQQERVTTFWGRSTRALENLIANRSARTERASQLLAALSYRGVLSRGFALVRDGEGHPLRAAAAVQPGMRLDIEFADGRVGATADGAAGATERTSAAVTKPAVAKPRKPGGGGGGSQGSLFG